MSILGARITCALKRNTLGMSYSDVYIIAHSIGRLVKHIPSIKTPKTGFKLLKSVKKYTLLSMKYNSKILFFVTYIVKFENALKNLLSTAILSTEYEYFKKKSKHSLSLLHKSKMTRVSKLGECPS